MEAPTPVSALIHAATMVNAGVYVLARFYPAFESVPYWKLSVVIVGVVSLLLAALMAMVATDLKRALAYSTISQLGYMVYAVGAGGIYASQFHLLSHAVFKALLFLGAGAVIHSLGRGICARWVAAGRPAVRTRGVHRRRASPGWIADHEWLWSKELVLEAGLAEGPYWAYLLALFTAGLTACYTFRMVWLIFFAESVTQPDHHPHDAPLAMRVALAPLAFGAFTTWLLAGPFSQSLSRTLPADTIEPATTLEIAMEVLRAPATWVALLVIATGLAAWWGRMRLAWPMKILAWLADWARAGFGFEAVNRWIVDYVRGAASDLASLQTGQLNWNLFGAAVGLLAVLAWLAWVAY